MELVDYAAYLWMLPLALMCSGIVVLGLGRAFGPAAGREEPVSEISTL